MLQTVEVDLGGRKITLETGRMAKQANGAVVVRSGDSVVLVTACMAEEPKPGAGFFPLTVDYREYTYAAGKIPGGFFKREGRPTEKEILSSRLIDRPVRPMFPEGFKDETQVIAMVLSADTENNPDVIGLIAGAAALYFSDIPFPTPVAGVRVALVEGHLVTNPTYSETKASLLNMVVAGSEDAIVMVEAGATEVSEEAVNDAIQYAHGEIRKIIAAEKELFEKLGIRKRVFVAPEFDKAIEDEVRAKVEAGLREAMDTSKYPKLDSQKRVAELRTEWLAGYPETEEEKRHKVAEAFDRLE